MIGQKRALSDDVSLTQGKPKNRTLTLLVRPRRLSARTILGNWKWPSENGCYSPLGRMLKVILDSTPKTLGYSTLSGLFIEGLHREQYPGIVAKTRARPGHPGDRFSLQDTGTGKRFWKGGATKMANANHMAQGETVTRPAVKSPSSATVPWMLVVLPTFTSLKVMDRRPSGVHL